MKLTKLFSLLSIFFLTACRPGGFSSDASEESDQKIDVPHDAGIPLIKIKSSKTIEDEPKVNATMQIVSHDSLLFDGNIGIEIRGAVSQMFYRKKSYGFEIRDETGKGLKKSLLGLPENEDWVLHGPYGDKTLLRNVVAYQLSNSIGRYAARTKFVELEINDKYLGYYVLIEKMKRGKERINVHKLEENDNDSAKISGGYILKLDKTVGGGNNGQDDYTAINSFKSEYDVNGKKTDKTITHFLYEDPKPKKITALQSNYIKNYMLNFERALAAPTFKEEAIGYRKYIDVPSFIDYFLLTELMQNHDGYRLSTYMQKDRGEKLKMGPIWDFDITFGSDGGMCNEMNTDNWVYKYSEFCPYDNWLVPFWWKRLLEDPKFKAEVVQRWTILRKNQFTDNQLDKVIDENNSVITKSGAVDRNFKKWLVLKKQIFPNQFTGNHPEEIARMKKWLKNHASWMDKELNR